MVAEPQFMQYISGRPFTEEESWLHFLRLAGHWALFDFGTWAVEEKQTGQYVGDVGFTDRRRELVPPLVGVPEIAWGLAPAVHGKGYGTEAVRAALKWADQHLEYPSTACIVHPENVASLRLAAKCGYKYAGRPTYQGEPVVLLMRPRA